MRVARLVRGPRNFLVWGSFSTKYVEIATATATATATIIYNSQMEQ